MNKEKIINILTEELGLVNYVNVTKYLANLDTEIIMLQQENKRLQERIDKAIEYDEYLMRVAKYHLNTGHLKKMRKILKGENNK